MLHVAKMLHFFENQLAFLTFIDNNKLEQHKLLKYYQNDLFGASGSVKCSNSSKIRAGIAYLKICCQAALLCEKCFEWAISYDWGKGFVMSTCQWKESQRQVETTVTGQIGNHCDADANVEPSSATWDKAIVLLLEHEEWLLGDIVRQCHDMVQVAEKQAWDMTVLLEDES